MNPARANFAFASFSANRVAFDGAVAQVSKPAVSRASSLQTPRSQTGALPSDALPIWKSATLRARFGYFGFTLIELLVVISVIALLAGLTVGLSGVAGRKSKEARLRGDLNRLVTLIDNYKARMGFYPPSPEKIVRGSSANPYDIPNPPFNQLFYELSGTIFTNPPQFFVPGHPPLSVNQVVNLFQSDGFANSARDQRGIRFTAEFKSSDVRRVEASAYMPNLPNTQAEILVAPVGPPASPNPAVISLTAVTGGRYYPWYYDSSSTNRINADGFDLWTIVEIGKKVIRFSNWEDGPVVLGP
jgi:prepilin-type N-terminal cleavage/methylation domain-containing protein